MLADTKIFSLLATVSLSNKRREVMGALYKQLCQPDKKHGPQQAVYSQPNWGTNTCFYGSLIPTFTVRKASLLHISCVNVHTCINVCVGVWLLVCYTNGSLSWQFPLPTSLIQLLIYNVHIEVCVHTCLRHGQTHELLSATHTCTHSANTLYTYIIISLHCYNRWHVYCTHNSIPGHPLISLSHTHTQSAEVEGVG